MALHNLTSIYSHQDQPTSDHGRGYDHTRATRAVCRPDPTNNALCCPSGMRRNHGIGPMPHVSTPTGTPRGGACHPPFATLPPPGRHRRATDPISMYTGARLYRVTAYTSHLYRQLRTKAPLFVGRQCALSMTVHHACLHEHRVSTLRATLCMRMHPAQLHSVFVSFLSPCFGCRRRCPAQ